MVGSLSRLLRVRRRGNVDSLGVPSLGHPESSNNQHQRLEKRSSISSISCYPLKLFAGVLIMLMVVLNANSLINSANNSIDEHITVTKRIITPEDDLPSLRGVLYSVDRKFPRTINISSQSRSESTILTDVPYTKDFERNSIPSKAPLLMPEWFEPNALELIRGYNRKACKPKHDWQSKSFPNCNMFHETNLSEMKFLTSGTIRSVFELRENIDGHVNKFVYKSLDFSGRHHDVTPERVNQERKDALVMERTTGSRFIPNIHAYCSTVVIMEHAPRDMQSYNKKRLAKSITISPLDRLKIGIHIASGVADLHTVDFIHNDLHEQQFLFQDGVFKLNDFNYAKPMYADKSTNGTCTLPKFSMGLFGRSLEELQYKVGYKGFTPSTPDNIDIWIMGNLMYTILTDLQVWNKRLRSNEGVKRKKAKRIVAGKGLGFPRKSRKVMIQRM